MRRKEGKKKVSLRFKFLFSSFIVRPESAGSRERFSRSPKSRERSLLLVWSLLSCAPPSLFLASSGLCFVQEISSGTQFCVEKWRKWRPRESVLLGARSKEAIGLWALGIWRI